MEKEQEDLFNKIKLTGNQLSSLSAFMQNDFDMLLQNGVTKQQLFDSGNELVISANRLMQEYSQLISQSQQLILSYTK